MVPLAQPKLGQARRIGTQAEVGARGVDEARVCVGEAVHVLATGLPRLTSARVPKKGQVRPNGAVDVDVDVGEASEKYLRTRTPAPASGSHPATSS